MALPPIFGLLCVVACKPDYPSCKKDKHCNAEDGEKCVEGLCQNCTTNEDCTGKGPDAANWICHEFRCTDPARVPGGAGAGGQGSPCTDASMCADGLTCREGSCDVCLQDGDCAGGTCDLETGRCSQPGAAAGTCTTDDQCPMDEICDHGTCVFSGQYGGDGTVLCELQAVYFDFDSPALEPDVQEQLESAASCLAEQGRLVYLEAHADPRGTEEYNILLTDKRGQSVRTFLQQLGVSAENMQVISKGSLESNGTDENGWSKDRRVEFIWP